MPHITLLTLDYPPEQGGVARYLGELVRAAGDSMSVIVERKHTLSGPGNVTEKELFQSSWPSWWPMVNICRTLPRDSELLVSHVLPVGTAAWLSSFLGGPRYSVICHGLDVRLAVLSPLKRWLFQQVCLRAHTVIANSESTAESIHQVVPKLPILILTPGVHVPSQMTQEEARKRLGVSAEDEIILSVGRLIKRKGFDLLLEATERLRDRDRVKTVIIGDGAERANLKQLAGHLKHPVRFIHDASDEITALWYAAADVFCLPTRESAGDVEGFGIVYLEAAAHGLPVVASYAGGAGEAVVDAKTGLLVPPEDAQAVSDALKRLLDNPGLRVTLGSAGRERVATAFRWQDRWERLNIALKRDEMRGV